VVVAADDAAPGARSVIVRRRAPVDMVRAGEAQLSARASFTRQAQAGAPLVKQF
jgi:hypothetical protein